MAKKRAFVRYSKQGKIVPGSLILTGGSHPNGPSTWKEVPADLCCDNTSCTPTNYGDWRLVTGGEAGDGVVLVDEYDPEECPRFTFVGPNDDGIGGNDADDGWVYLKQYFSSTTCLQIDYEWTSFDDSNPSAPPSVDWPVYWTSTTEPTGAPADDTVRVDSTPDGGTWNITVPGGQWFAIGIYSSDSCCGRGFLTVEICEEPCPTTTTTTSSPTSCCTPTIAWNQGASGDGGSQLDFTYVGGPSCIACTDLKLQYSTDNITWTNYSPLFECNATGVLFDWVAAGISFNSTYYVRLITICYNNAESIASVSVPVTAL